MKNMLRTLALSVLLAGPALAQAPPGLTESERKAGAEAHPQILQQFGGAMSGPVADYVRSVGQKIAVQSGGGARATDYNVTLLNSNVNNAFAIPGGYVYITRQLLALMNDEAELAFVMGHEVAHVAARHGQKRQNRAALSNVLAGVAGVLTGSDLIGRGAGLVAGLTTLGYSREQERQADSLGVRYLVSAGYDPNAGTDSLAALGAQTALEARLKGQGGAEPSKWLSTHPPSGERVARMRTEAQALAPRAGKTLNRDAFLNAIDGMIYDDDPAEGVVVGNGFRHGGLALALDAPQGFAITNSPQAVTGTGPGNLKFDLRAADARTSDLNAIASARWQQLGVSAQPMRATRINGVEALEGSIRAGSQGGPVEATLTVYRWSPQLALTLVSIAPQGQGGSVAPVAASVRKMTPQEIAGIRSRRVTVVRVGPKDTLQGLADRMAYSDDRMARFLTLNQLDANAQLKAGDRVKLVTLR
ncbi:M48 family metalloprotease [Sandarakinorhabdus sp. AAP62]|uniref:M48 family metalloprotease n=1 Tax=Sandarakinorhabdus sp. AAP62 TaxID=1248916 RepID=UPI00031D2653|nr:M48 family metalloprotease [Sandarakinorhabdus sp. AAP62]